MMRPADVAWNVIGPIDLLGAGDGTGGSRALVLIGSFTDATPVIRRMDTGGAGDACLSLTSSRTRIVEGVMW
ncbi:MULTISPECIES: hypothetical protein [unclassified Methylobacterium]|uniref:hypothetical protein n=1 Tax=unclassified Methylobacterium TaxID=2615210 RepID=UPI0011C1ED74|nr:MULTISPECIES: hypothetical protein [unclassified Methylobacterium]QEE39809.1 hypothetical protein FVA80_13470 [Methylobacterium sp. WL1]TXN57347.1 hypothetical protein FV241_11840 [Methylobacterium sp. WL2]